MAHNKPKIEIEVNGASSASGTIPRFDEGYLFDDPLLFYDKAYPGNTTHSQSQQPKINSEKIP